MKTLYDFQCFYENILYPSVMEVYHLQNRLSKKEDTKVLVIFSTHIFCVVLFVVTFVKGLSLWYLCLSILFYIFISLLLGRGIPALRQRYIRDFEEKIVFPIARFVNPRAHYSPEDFIPYEIFCQSGLFTKTPDNYTGSHLISWSIGPLRAAFSYIHTWYTETEHDFDDEYGISSHTVSVDIFKGVFFVVDFPKTHYYPLKLRPRGYEKPQKLSMENQAFNHFFRYEGPDPIEVRYLLTPVMMERLTDLAAEVNGQMSCSFVDGRLYVAVSKVGDFSPPQKPISYQLVERIFREMSFCTSLAELAYLDRRLGIKERSR
ncbi:MAG: DUF3137 domain-containing protein [Syntrophales bacterium]|nr:DUF3137 domain-containing protein [Syntrophales bacterium]